MKRYIIAAALICASLTGCMTAEDKAAKQAYDSRPQLGVTFEPEWWSENTVMLRDVPADSSAGRAGLKSLDQIVSFDGKPVTTVKSLDDLEMAAQHGQVVQLGIVRDTRRMNVTVTLQ